MTGTDVDPWLTYQQAAQIVGVHVNTIRRAAKRGDLQVSRMGYRIVRIRLSWLDGWLTAAHAQAVGRPKVA